MQPPAKHEQVTSGIFLLLIGRKSCLKFSLIGTSVEARRQTQQLNQSKPMLSIVTKNASEPMQPAAKRGKTLSHTHVRAKSRVA